jgi:hypothetical protein
MRPPRIPPIIVPRPRRSAASRLGTTFFLLLVCAGIGVARMVARRGGTSLGEIGLPVVSMSNVRWEGHAAILVDVNGDRTPDVVGRVRYVLGGGYAAIAAFDGATGAKLWESDALGTNEGALGLADDVLLFASGSGELRGYGVHDGKRRFAGSLPEKATEFCRGDRGGEVRVRLADQRTTIVRLSDGQASAPTAAQAHSPRGKERDAEGCTRLVDDGKAGDVGYELRSAGSRDPAVEGMSVRTVLQRPGGPKVLLGTRDRGTSVPMIAAAFEDTSRNWKSDLPGSKPLEASTSAPEVGAVTQNRAFTEYGWSDIMRPHSLVCFDLAGHRQWERALPSDDPIHSIHATEQRVYVSQWGHLSAYESSSGRPLFSVGL